MKTPLAVAVLVPLLAACASTAVSAPALAELAASGKTSVDERLAWMAGCWGGEKETTRFRENWMVVSPDLLLGVSATTKPSAPVEFEFLRIEGRAGGPVYVAQPGGAPATSFPLSAADSGAESATFVNLQHDFPKRIGYKRVDADSLLAWIDAGAKGSLRIEFPMRRVACPGAVR
jgi:hypothetical protein